MSQSLLNIEGVLSASIDAGIKGNDALDLSVIYLTETTTTAAVFTQNVFCAAPVVIAKNHLNHNPKALLINSGNANAGTGTQGMENTLHACACLAGELNINTEQVLPFSTGVIGQQLDVSKFDKGIPKAIVKLSADAMGDVAKGILTTDLVEKTATVQFEANGKTVTISGIAKGSGMISPD
ncbi:MAG: bifunctional ornithine acetyltransferase/N-acetylglutamate synthase, partial [Gammaproteobacteria bacterium]